jgi:HAD superfamily hydrolase (TIGR01549 family)
MGLSKAYGLNMRYPVLFLDMDHTLCDTQKADDVGTEYLTGVVAEGLEMKPETAELKVRYFMRLLYEGHSSCPKREGEPETLHRAKLLRCALGDAAHLNLDQAQAWVEALMAKRFEHFDFFEGCTEMLARLRQQRRTVVITNGPAYSQKPKVERVNLEQHVDRVLLAADYPWQKPAPEIFQAALELEGVSEEKVLHVGDSLASDIAGAVASNIDSCWINPTGRTGPKFPKPSFEIAVITDLEALLED